MTKELEPRAAKALGCIPETHPHTWRCPPAITSICGVDKMSVIYTNEFKFTTSLEWSILGIKECHRRGGFYITNLNARLRGLMNGYNSDNVHAKTLLLPPLKITLAWLVALEENPNE